MICSCNLECADLSPVPKVAKPRWIELDLRPISLTPVLSKILEWVVSCWLLLYIRPCINASVPQGTRLGPIFFLIMINDLDCNLPIYKYVDDCTVYEIIPQSSTMSSFQLAMDQITQWTECNNMSLNVKKTKELLISVFKKPVQLTI